MNDIPPTVLVSPDEARKIAAEAYVYAYAPLFNYKTLFQQTQDSSFPGYIGWFGKFRHYARGFRPEDTDIVTPSNDTPYSWAWLDLRAEPVVLSVPAIPNRSDTGSRGESGDPPSTEWTFAGKGCCQGMVTGVDELVVTTAVG